MLGDLMLEAGWLVTIRRRPPRRKTSKGIPTPHRTERLLPEDRTTANRSSSVFLKVASGYKNRRYLVSASEPKLMYSAPVLYHFFSYFHNISGNDNASSNLGCQPVNLFFWEDLVAWNT
jgi:hypothetical protein